MFGWKTIQVGVFQDRIEAWNLSDPAVFEGYFYGSHTPDGLGNPIISLTFVVLAKIPFMDAYTFTSLIIIIHCWQACWQMCHRLKLSWRSSENVWTTITPHTNASCRIWAESGYSEEIHVSDLFPSLVLSPSHSLTRAHSHAHTEQLCQIDSKAPFEMREARVEERKHYWIISLPVFPLCSVVLIQK